MRNNRKSFAARVRCALALAMAMSGACVRDVDLDGEGAATSDGGSNNPNSRPDAITDGVVIAIENQETTMRVAADDTHLYWLSTLAGGWSDGMKSRYARIRGCAKIDCRSTIVTYDEVATEPGGALPPVQFSALAADGANVYWAQTRLRERRAITTCPSSGCLGAPRVIAMDVDAMTLVVDTTHVYWTSERDTAVMRVAKSGGTPEAIAVNEMRPGKLAVDDTHVYWIANSGAANASVKRVVKAGGESPVILAIEQNQAASIALDAKFVYWANAYSVGTIARCPLAGCVGAPETLATDQSDPNELLTDGRSLYWMTDVSAQNIEPILGTVVHCTIDDCKSTLETWAVQTFAYDGMSMALDESDLYWVAQGAEEGSGTRFYPQATIYRHPK
jgi:hypothetical protein